MQEVPTWVPALRALSSEGSTGLGAWGLEWTQKAQAARLAQWAGGLAGAGRHPGVGWELQGCACSDLLFSEGGDDSEPAPWPEALSAAQPSCGLAAPPRSPGFLHGGFAALDTWEGRAQRSQLVCERECGQGERPWCPPQPGSGHVRLSRIPQFDQTRWQPRDGASGDRNVTRASVDGIPGPIEMSGLLRPTAQRLRSGSHSAV